jgi:hypothetical protein
MDGGDIVHETEMRVAGKNFKVQVFSRDNGKYYSLTRLGDSDVIIIDGTSIEDVLTRHSFSLPIAIGCRTQWAKQPVMKYPAPLS